MFKYECKLEQQTGLLHFQHGQAGATLRATEVKPKLDKFLIRRYKKENPGNSIPDGWMIGSTDALNYKLRIEAKGEQEATAAGELMIQSIESKDLNRDRIKELRKKSDKEIEGFYYGNMVSERDCRRRVAAIRDTYKELVTNGNIRLTIICFIPELMEYIKENIKDFFLCENFGTCQNKGYGSFVLKHGDPALCSDITPEHIRDVLCEAYSAKACYYFSCSSQPLDKIATIYKIIKSGINFPNDNDPRRSKYRRSLLFLYMHQNYGIGNEKAWLKQKGYVRIPEGCKEFHANSEYEEPKYVRALLGVGDHLEFIKDLSNKGDKDRVSIESALPKDNPKRIERYPSTIFFKVIRDPDGEYTVYFIGKRIDKEIWGQEFKFNGHLISIPQKGTKGRNGECLDENFMDGFLRYCKDELNDSNPQNGQTSLGHFKDMRGIRIQEVK